MMGRVSVSLLAGCLWSAGVAVANESTAEPTHASGEVLSESGQLISTYSSSLEPLVINQIHSWVVHIETQTGEPLENAVISVSGGMPAHNHSLPTAPAVTVYLGNGDYLLEGMKFHMNGEWTVTLILVIEARQDSIIFRLEL